MLLNAMYNATISRMIQSENESRYKASLTLSRPAKKRPSSTPPTVTDQQVKVRRIAYAC